MSSKLIAAAAAVLCLAAAACSSDQQGQGRAEISTAHSHTTPTVPSSSATVTSPAASTTTHSSSSSPSVSIKHAPATPLREVTVTSVDGARKYDIKIWFEVQDDSCADHAYGTPVIQYLTAHPCHGLDRLLATTEVDGKAVGFAQSSLGFVGNAPGVYQTAGDFASLERQDGTGNVNDLLREGYRLPDGPSKLPSPDAFEVQSQDSGVTIVDAFYVSGKTPNNDPALIRMALDIYLQF